MDNTKITHHISKQFNEELEDIRNSVLNMGGMVEQQLANAMKALLEGDISIAEDVVAGDYKVNALEVAIDEECSRILARRQPAAFDLRLVVAVIKTITDLERIGDEAEKIANMMIHLAGMDSVTTNFDALLHMGETAQNMLNQALDAFARLDTELAIKTAKRDKKVDKEFDAINRQMITFMMEDPRCIKQSLDIMWSARALERIGDHACNICEYIIYQVKGKDIRHTSLSDLEHDDQ